MNRRQILSTTIIPFVLSGCTGLSYEITRVTRNCPFLGESPIVCEPTTQSDGNISFYLEYDSMSNIESVGLILENNSQKTFNYGGFRVYGRKNLDWNELIPETLYQGQPFLLPKEIQRWSIKVNTSSPQSRYEYGDRNSILLSGAEHEAYAFVLEGKLRDDEKQKSYVATLRISDQ